jgi:hypothetical protein
MWSVDPVNASTVVSMTSYSVWTGPDETDNSVEVDSFDEGWKLLTSTFVDQPATLQSCVPLSDPDLVAKMVNSDATFSDLSDLDATGRLRFVEKIVREPSESDEPNENPMRYRAYALPTDVS